MNFINYGENHRPYECTGRRSCPSEGWHHENCQGLALQLVKMKQNRREYYATGGYHGRGN